MSNSRKIVFSLTKLNLDLSSIYDHTPICGITYLELCFYNIQQIGEGSLGLVYKARSYEDHKLYAIKKLKTPLLNNNDRSLKLEEIRKHAAIPKHPNCMQFYRAWTENNFLYTQLELCDDDFPLKYYSFFRLTNIKLEKVIRI